MKIFSNSIKHSPLIIIIAISFMIFGCQNTPNSPSTSVSNDDQNFEMQTVPPTNYGNFSPVTQLDIKYERMLVHCRNDVEAEILRVVYNALRWGREMGLWLDVNMEDMMAEARQESGGTIDLLNNGGDISPEGSVGTNVWNFHQIPGNDLNGMISLSVWQDVTAFYLIIGRKYNQEVAQLVEDYAVKYGLEPGAEKTDSAIEKAVWGFVEKMEAAEGKEKAQQLFDLFIAKLTDIVDRDPELHVKVVAEHFEEDFKMHGARSPNGIREYFYLPIQKNLDPKNWLNPVRFDDDIPPTAENNWADNNVSKRGDYGKQVALGNTYNDRGMIYWYAVTRDATSIEKMVEAWKDDPAKITREDFVMLKDKGYLSWVTEFPAVYPFILAHLPAAQ